MTNTEKEKQIIDILAHKSIIKQKVYNNTLKSFKLLKDVLKELSDHYNSLLQEKLGRPLLSFKDRGILMCELTVGSDLLVFYMHSNIFEFDRDHGIWRISYVRDNKDVTYSGIINIYNFLVDSFKFSRYEDEGYLIARIFVNKEMNYFVEGKRQMGYYHNTFGRAKINKDILKDIVDTAILYSLQFDLLVPPYDNVMVASVGNILEKRRRMLNIKTGKRVGFSFKSDDVKGNDKKT